MGALNSYRTSWVAQCLSSLFLKVILVGDVTISSAPSVHSSFNKMACSNIRYGAGVTKEIGMFIKTTILDIRAAAILDRYVTVTQLTQKLLSRIQICEERSNFLKVAIDFAKKEHFDLFIAVGGGSVIDTCKAANLYSCAPEGTQLLDHVNAPLGKAIPVTFPLKPLIAVPTTSGTGSETTAVSIFDHIPTKAKTGISDRSMRPLLGIVDPLHTKTMPERVIVYTGFDVLCHALESYTAIPYYERKPCPSNPINRPAYQGSNPISDVWSIHALRIISKYLKRSANDPSDFEARSQMHLASTFAGIGFGNAGCHLCHAMSYPISGNVKTYKAKGYNVNHPLVPHGLSVVMTAPAVFNFTAPACPERHLEGARALGVDVTNAKKADAGKILGDKLRELMSDMNIENGLIPLGYTKDDIPELVKRTLPQV
ncbi:Hydroxyacid-oxoacid transhydrogenase, mitochondrial [Nymphon striatum]|nr:Hydroxyacid-oxoacid transhydrogenase, mitochondrial [Nymphon striatum]